MTAARQLAAWDHTAMILAKIHNTICLKQSEMIRDPSVFNPFRKPKPKVYVPLKQIRAAMAAQRGN